MAARKQLHKRGRVKRSPAVAAAIPPPQRPRDDTPNTQGPSTPSAAAAAAHVPAAPCTSAACSDQVEQRNAALRQGRHISAESGIHSPAAPTTRAAARAAAGRAGGTTARPTAGETPAAATAAAEKKATTRKTIANNLSRSQAEASAGARDSKTHSGSKHQQAAREKRMMVVAKRASSIPQYPTQTTVDTHCVKLARRTVFAEESSIETQSPREVDHRKIRKRRLLSKSKRLHMTAATITSPPPTAPAEWRTASSTHTATAIETARRLSAAVKGQVELLEAPVQPSARTVKPDKNNRISQRNAGRGRRSAHDPSRLDRQQGAHVLAASTLAAAGRKKTSMPVLAEHSCRIRLGVQDIRICSEKCIEDTNSCHVIQPTVTVVASPGHHCCSPQASVASSPSQSPQIQTLSTTTTPIPVLVNSSVAEGEKKHNLPQKREKSNSAGCRRIGGSSKLWSCARDLGESIGVVPKSQGVIEREAEISISRNTSNRKSRISSSRNQMSSSCSRKRCQKGTTRRSTSSKKPDSSSRAHSKNSSRGKRARRRSTSVCPTSPTSASGPSCQASRRQRRLVAATNETAKMLQDSIGVTSPTIPYSDTGSSIEVSIRIPVRSPCNHTEISQSEKADHTSSSSFSSLQVAHGRSQHARQTSQQSSSPPARKRHVPPRTASNFSRLAAVSFTRVANESSPHRVPRPAIRRDASAAAFSRTMNTVAPAVSSPTQSSSYHKKFKTTSTTTASTFPSSFPTALSAAETNDSHTRASKRLRSRSNTSTRKRRKKSLRQIPSSSSRAASPRTTPCLSSPLPHSPSSFSLSPSFSSSSSPTTSPSPSASPPPPSSSSSSSSSSTPSSPPFSSFPFTTTTSSSSSSSSSSSFSSAALHISSATQHSSSRDNKRPPQSGRKDRKFAASSLKQQTPLLPAITFAAKTPDPLSTPLLQENQQQQTKETTGCSSSPDIENTGMYPRRSRRLQQQHAQLVPPPPFENHKETNNEQQQASRHWISSQTREKSTKGRKKNSSSTRKQRPSNAGALKERNTGSTRRRKRQSKRQDGRNTTTSTISATAAAAAAAVEAETSADPTLLENQTCSERSPSQKRRALASSFTSPFSSPSSSSSRCASTSGSTPVSTSSSSSSASRTFPSSSRASRQSRTAETSSFAQTRVNAAVSRSAPSGAIAAQHTQSAIAVDPDSPTAGAADLPSVATDTAIPYFAGFPAAPPVSHSIIHIASYPAAAAAASVHTSLETIPQSAAAADLPRYAAVAATIPRFAARGAVTRSTATERASRSDSSLSSRGAAASTFLSFPEEGSGAAANRPNFEIQATNRYPAATAISAVADSAAEYCAVTHFTGASTHVKSLILPTREEEGNVSPVEEAIAERREKMDSRRKRVSFAENIELLGHGFAAPPTQGSSPDTAATIVPSGKTIAASAAAKPAAAAAVAATLVAETAAAEVATAASKTPFSAEGGAALASGATRSAAAAAADAPAPSMESLWAAIVKPARGTSDAWHACELAAPMASAAVTQVKSRTATGATEPYGVTAAPVARNGTASGSFPVAELAATKAHPVGLLSADLAIVKRRFISKNTDSSKFRIHLARLYRFISSIVVWLWKFLTIQPFLYVSSMEEVVPVYPSIVSDMCWPSAELEEEEGKEEKESNRHVLKRQQQHLPEKRDKTSNSRGSYFAFERQGNCEMILVKDENNNNSTSDGTNTSDDSSSSNDNSRSNSISDSNSSNSISNSSNSNSSTGNSSRTEKSQRSSSTEKDSSGRSTENSTEPFPGQITPKDIGRSERDPISTTHGTSTFQRTNDFDKSLAGSCSSTNYRDRRQSISSPVKSCDWSSKTATLSCIALVFAAGAALYIIDSIQVELNACPSGSRG